MARVLVLSDVHGNLEALQAVLSAARGWDEVLVLGDLVDYGPWPGEVIDALRGLGARVVKGNHDHAAAFGVDCRCGEKTHWLSTWFRENITVRLLSRRDLEYLAGLPEKLVLDTPVGSLAAVHGAPASPLYGYLHPWLGEEAVCAMLRPGARLAPVSRRGGCRPRHSVYLVGHTHYQFLRVVGGSRVVNPGSVGQPRDGDPRAAYAVLDTETGEVVFGRARYDVSRVLRTLEALGIPEPYMCALRVMLLEARVPEPPRGAV